MPGKWKDLKRRMPAEQRARMAEKAQQISEEIDALNAIREALGVTQEELAEKLQIRQSNVSRLERRSDVQLSTLYDYVHALGGELDVRIRLPDGREVRLRQFEPV